MIKRFFEFSYEFSFVIIFITIFFFTIGIKLEHDSTDRQLTNMINDMYDTLFSDTLNILLTDKKNVIKNIIKNNKEPDYNLNKKLTRNLIVILSVIFLVIVLIWYKFKNKHQLNFRQIIIENIVLFIFVGSFEYIFFSKFVIKYIPITPSEIEVSMRKKLEEKIKKTVGVDIEKIRKILRYLGLI